MSAVWEALRCRYDAVTGTEGSLAFPPPEVVVAKRPGTVMVAAEGAGGAGEGVLMPLIVVCTISSSNQVQNRNFTYVSTSRHRAQRMHGTQNHTASEMKCDAKYFKPSGGVTID